MQGTSPGRVKIRVAVMSEKLTTLKGTEMTTLMTTLKNMDFSPSAFPLKPVSVKIMVKATRVMY